MAKERPKSDPIDLYNGIIVNHNSEIKKFTPYIRLSRSASNPPSYRLKIMIPLPENFTLQKNDEGQPQIVRRMVQNDCIIVINIEQTDDFEQEEHFWEIKRVEMLEVYIDSNEHLYQENSKVIVICAYGDPDEGSASSGNFADADEWE